MPESVAITRRDLDLRAGSARFDGGRGLASARGAAPRRSSGSMPRGGRRPESGSRPCWTPARPPSSWASGLAIRSTTSGAGHSGAGVVTVIGSVHGRRVMVVANDATVKAGALASR